MTPCNVFYRIKPHYGAALPRLVRMSLESIPPLCYNAQQGFSTQPEVQALLPVLSTGDGVITIESIIPLRGHNG